MLQKSSSRTYFMVYAAAIAAIYTVLTMVFAPISFGPIQFRISEALCILPFFTPAAALDIIFGSLATLIGALGSWMLRKNKWAVCLPPILANTIVIPWVLRFAYGSEDMILYAMVTVGIGEILAIGVLGNLLMGVLYKYRQIMFGKKNLA